MKEKIIQILKYVLSPVLAAVLLYFAFRGIDFQEFRSDIVLTRWGWILLSVAAAIAAVVLRALRWHLQLSAVDPEISLGNVWHCSNVGNFLSIIIPGTGEVYRCVRVSTKKSGMDRTLGTILVERAWDLLAVGALLLLALALNADTLADFLRRNVVEPLGGSIGALFWWILGGGAAILVVAAVLVVKFAPHSNFCSKCAGVLKGIADGITAFGRMRGKWLFLVYTVGIWVAYILMTMFTFYAIPELAHLGFGDATFISAVGNIASVIPTPGNLGAYHWLVGMAISNIYLGAGEMVSAALLCATLSHGFHALLLILLGIVSYFHKIIKN